MLGMGKRMLGARVGERTVGGRKWVGGRRRAYLC